MPIRTFLTILLALSAANAGEVTYSIRTIAGGNFVGDGGPATAAQLSDAQGIALDGAGNLYIADTDNHRVRKVSSDGVIQTLAGTGTPGYSGDDGPAAAAMLNQPYGVAVDRARNVYIADLGNGRVRRVSPDGVITTVAGDGRSISSGDGGPAVAASLSAPRNVAVDPAGSLYISDFAASLIRKVTGGVITTYAGGALPGRAEPELAYPCGLAFDAAGDLYVADSGNHRIRKMSGGVLQTVYGGEGVLNLPTSVSFDSSGTLYVADSLSRRVIALAQTGGVRTIAGTGSSGGLTSLDSARDVAVDAAGNLYIADRRRVRRLAPSGAFATAAGDGTFGYRGDGVDATLAMLNGPSGVAVGFDGSVYITDEQNHRVRKVSPAGIITAVAGTGVPGFGFDGFTAAHTALDSPTGITIDAGGVLWLAEGGRIRKIVAGGAIATAAGTGSHGYNGDDRLATLAQLRSPTFAVLDGSGNLHIADQQNHRVRKVTPSGVISTVAGTGVEGFSGDGGTAASAQLSSPSALAFDNAGNLYIADTGNNRIRKVSLDRRMSTVVGGPGRLDSPRGVAIDPALNLYVADTQGQRIVRVSPDGIETVIAGKGTAGFGGDGGPATSALFNHPAAITLDAAGNIYIADKFNQRIRKMSLEQPQAPAVEPPATAVLRVVNAASLSSGPIAPGEIVSLFAAGIGPLQPRAGVLQASGLLESAVNGTEVFFDGVAAPLLYVQENQINAVVPYAVAGKSRTVIDAVRQGQRIVATTVDVARTAPGLFTFNLGAGQAVALNQDGGLNSAGKPEARGSIVTLFATGEGQTFPAGVDGKPWTQPYSSPALPVSVSVGGHQAEILFVGGAPGFIGLLQINARIPTGGLLGAVPVVLQVGSARSQEGVTIAVF